MRGPRKSTLSSPRRRRITLSRGRRRRSRRAGSGDALAPPCGTITAVLLSIPPLAACAGGQQEAHDRAHGQDGAQDDVAVPVVIAADALDDLHGSLFFLLSTPLVSALSATCFCSQCHLV